MDSLTGSDVTKAAEILNAGGLVAIPTETVYGLAANGLNEHSVKRIYEVKGRPQANPLILHIGSIDEVTEYARDVPAVAWQLMDLFCPGPLTLVLPKRSLVPDLVTAGHSTVALRIPAHPVAHALLQLVKLPLAAPSANPSGYISPTTAQHVVSTLGAKVDYILDGGECMAGIESTIIGFRDEVPVIYRQGVITASDIASVAGAVREHTGNVLLAPGMSRSHYKPRTKLLLVDDLPGAISQHHGSRVGILTYGNYASSLPVGQQQLLCYGPDYRSAARNLYAAMHTLDASDYDLIIARRFPSDGIGRALNDRLSRAAAE